MEEVYVVFKCDVWHSNDSKSILGIATDWSYALEICRLQAQKEGEEISDEQFELLDQIHQTQGYSSEGEFMIESYKTNQLVYV